MAVKTEAGAKGLRKTSHFLRVWRHALWPVMEALPMDEV